MRRRSESSEFIILRGVAPRVHVRAVCLAALPGNRDSNVSKEGYGEAPPYMPQNLGTTSLGIDRSGTLQARQSQNESWGAARVSRDHAPTLHDDPVPTLQRRPEFLSIDAPGHSLTSIHRELSLAKVFLSQAALPSKVYRHAARVAESPCSASKQSGMRSSASAAATLAKP